jgi:Ca2+-binding EF-hand superfamily protein
MGQQCCNQQTASNAAEFSQERKGEEVLKKIFQGMDNDADGKVTVGELNSALRQSDELQELFNMKYFSKGKGNGKGAVPKPPVFFEKLIEKFDNDGDRKISYDEFVNYFLPKLDSHQGDMVESWAALWKTFNEIDLDHSAKVTLKELHAALRDSPDVQRLFNFEYYKESAKGKGKGRVPPPPQVFEKLIKDLDKDGDNQISWNEFVAHFRK